MGECLMTTLYYTLASAFLLSILGWIAYEIIHEKGYQSGYWSGRASGWKSCLDHQAKIQKLKIEQVFDYDKN